MPSTERLFKRIAAPVTTPRTKRALIGVRDRAVATAADLRSRAGRGRLPDLVIAGVQKGGTTFLYQELTRHPDVGPALTKELHFFDDNWRRGIDHYRGDFRRDGRLAVEASPGYVFHPLALSRLTDAVPGVKVVLVLRDPVKRAYSQYQHEVRLGFETAATFEDALALEDDRLDGERDRLLADDGYRSYSWRHHSYRSRGEYLSQVEAVERLLPSDRLLVLRSEHLYDATSATMARVHAFAGLAPFDPGAPGTNDMAAGGQPIDPATAATLAAHYRPHNAALAAHLGWSDLDWS